jgi:hypothetical protein
MKVLNSKKIHPYGLLIQELTIIVFLPGQEVFAVPLVNSIILVSALSFGVLLGVALAAHITTTWTAP